MSPATSDKDDAENVSKHDAGNAATVPAPVRTIQSIDRTVMIVNLLAEESSGYTLTQLAQRMKLPLQTLQSLLRTLQHHEWVVQERRGKPYRLGPGIGLINRRWLGNQDRAALGAEAVEELSLRLREYVILAEWAGGQLTSLAESHPSRQLVVRGEVHSADRLHTMATGKMLLASLDPQRRKEIVSTMPMSRQGPRSITDRAVFMRHLVQVAQQGFAICKDEAARGVVALAVPVASVPGTRAALGVALPQARYSDDRQKQLLFEMRLAAAQIERSWQTAPAAQEENGRK